MQFYDRFRLALRRYADGVHALGSAATAGAIAATELRLGRPLPPPLRDFLRLWNGASLFNDLFRIYGADSAEPALARLAVDELGIAVGAGAAERLLLDAAGRVIAIDESTESMTVVGSSFDRWLEATMAREGLLHDREGEFREQAFDGGEIAPRVARKRAEVACKADPESPAWHEELGLLLAAEGDPAGARASLERAVALDPALPAVWFALGKLGRQLADEATAAAAFARAGEQYQEPAEAAFAFACAARSFTAAGDSPLARAAGERAALASPRFAADQRAAAEHLLGEGDFDAALEHIALGLAVAPQDEALGLALRLTRARAALRAV